MLRKKNIFIPNFLDEYFQYFNVFIIECLLNSS